MPVYSMHTPTEEFLGFMKRTADLLKQGNYKSLGKMEISERGHYEIELYGYHIVTQFLPLYDTDDDDADSGALAVLFYTHYMDKPLQIMTLHVRHEENIYINGKPENISIWKSRYNSGQSESFLLHLNDVFVTKVGELVDSVAKVRNES